MKIKKWVKVSGIIVGGIIIISIIGNMASGGNSEPAKKLSSPNTQQPAKPADTKPAEQQAGGINQETFDKIRTGDSLTGDGGMSVDEVRAILGKEDNDITSTTTINGKTTRMDVCTWAAGLQMKSITVTFVNGFAASKGMMK
jgi:hypothetical protein